MPPVYSPSALLPPIKKPRAYDNPSAPDIYAPPSSPDAGGGFQMASPDVVQDIYLPQLNQTAQELQSAYAPPNISGKRRFLGALVGGITKNPEIGGLVTGETQRQQRIQGLTGEYNTTANAINTNLQSSLVQTPYGEVPLSVAKNIIPEEIRQGGAANVANIRAGATTGAAQIAHRFIPVAGVGVIDTQGQNGAQVIPNTSNSVPITADIASEYNLDPSFIGKQLPLQSMIQAENALRFSYVDVGGTNDQYLVNKNPASPSFGQKIPLGVGNPSQGRVVQVADPNNPGNTTYTTGAQAISRGAAGPSSAAVQVPRRAQEAAVPTNIGNQIVAFNTALQHADLLEQVARALENGDTRTLNSITNAFESQFGSPIPNNFATVANAYNNEINKILGGGNATEQDLKTSGSTLPANANFETLKEALENYKKLAQSKINVLRGQTQAAVGASQRPNTSPQAQAVPSFRQWKESQGASAGR